MQSKPLSFLNKTKIRTGILISVSVWLKIGFKNWEFSWNANLWRLKTGKFPGNWSQSNSRWILMKLHGCIPWSGPMFPIVLLPDTMNYVPLAAISNLLKIDFFLAKFSDTIWPINMGLLIIKLYGHYSASHVIWHPLPPPSQWSPLG